MLIGQLLALLIFYYLFDINYWSISNYVEVSRYNYDLNKINETDVKWRLIDWSTKRLMFLSYRKIFLLYGETCCFCSYYPLIKLK